MVAAQFSGGRSSARMLHLMCERGMTPDKVIFCNTGTETPETYTFIAAKPDLQGEFDFGSCGCGT